jgi:uncharacterized membrane protein YfcA
LKTALLATLSALWAWYAWYWLRRLFGRHLGTKPTTSPTLRPSALQIAIGFVTNFFDTLGIGNFAPTTAIYRFTRMVPDERIPGTMTVGHTLPVVVEALLFITIVEVEPWTLVLMIAASVVGAWLGSGIVASLPRRRIQIGLGVALALAAAFMALGQVDAFPLGGDALGLDGFPLAVAVLAIGVLGALMPIGVGLYAPCMILVSVLGMNPKAAFPIMMGACAFLMPVASARFVRRERYAPRAALGLTLGGIPGVIVAAFVVKSLPLDTVRWLVVVVVAYTAVVMLRAARTGERSEPA